MQIPTRNHQILTTEHTHATQELEVTGILEDRDSYIELRQEK